MSRLAVGLACLLCTLVPGCSDDGPDNEVSFHGGGGGMQSGRATCPQGSVDLGVVLRGDSGSIVVTVDASAGLGGMAVHEMRTFRPTFFDQTSSEHFSGFDGEFPVEFTVVRSDDWQGRYTVTLAC